MNENIDFIVLEHDDAAEKRDPCLIGAMAQASAAKSATAEGEADGKKL